MGPWGTPSTGTTVHHQRGTGAALAAACKQNKDQRTQLRSTQTKDEVLTETEQAEGGETHLLRSPSLCSEPSTRSD